MLRTYDRMRSVVRLTTAIAIVAAIAAQMQALASDGILRPVNFFSFFTIDSNILAALTLLGLEFADSTPPGRLARWMRGGVTLYMTMTGIIYAVLLAPIAADVSTQSNWVNTIVHVAAPIVVIVDWFLAPSVPPPSRTSALWWLTFPFLWVTYTVIRGLIVDWYPYPFIDPRDDVEHAAGSWSAVIATTLALTMFVDRVGAADPVVDRQARRGPCG